MSHHLTKEFVEQRTSVVSLVPDEWQLGGHQAYKLEFKMCQLQQVAYDFKWGDERAPLPKHVSITETPSKIVVLDLSLNELVSLDYDGLAPLNHLRHLDASLNRIESYKGVEALPMLHTLNLSNNFIRSLDAGLGRCQHLTVLDLSMNHIQDISFLPPLSNLAVLHLNNNKLRTLDGIQGLSHLSELYVQRNQLDLECSSTFSGLHMYSQSAPVTANPLTGETGLEIDILPLSSSRRLSVLNASDNNINVLKSTAEVLRGLPRLTAVSLYGNPIEKEASYNSQLLDGSTVNMLDHVNTKPLPKTINKHQQNPNLMTIKDAAKQAFYDVILDRRRQTEDNVRFMQERIRQMQSDFKEWEDKMHLDMNACVRHLDSLNSNDLLRYDPDWLRDTIKTPTHSKPWQTLPYIPLRDNNPMSKYWEPKVGATDPKPAPAVDKTKESLPVRSPSRDKLDYTGVKDPDEVLRHVFNELAVEQRERPSRQGKSPYIH